MLALVPWRLHQRFAAWSVPRVLPYLSMIRVAPLVGGFGLVAAIVWPLVSEQRIQGERHARLVERALSASITHERIMTRLRIPILTALACIAPSLARSQDRTSAALMARIEAAQPSAGPNELGALTLTQLMERFKVPGVSIAVIHNFEIHWAKGYGTRDVETGATVDAETMFQAASISKPVAAMGVMKAVQNGLFTLDTDINRILTSWKLDGQGFTTERPVTPRGLTSHTSGLGDGFGFPGYDPAGKLPTVVQILEGQPPSNVRRIFMERAPGTLMEYSGGGVTLMQLALSDVRKRPFADVLRDDVLRPIGMVNSTYEQPLSPTRDRNAARAHDGEGKSRGAKWHVYPELAAAGLWTTPTDLARFAIEVQKSAMGASNRVLSRANVMEMLTPVGVGDFAVGFTIEKLGQGWYFSHGGSNWGFQCLLRAHRSKGYGFAIMTNADRGGALAAELGRRIQRAYEWDAVAEAAPRGYAPPPSRADITLPRDVMAQYVGVYQSPQLTFTVSLEDGLLHVTPSGQAKVRLYAAARDTLFPRVVNATFVMTRDSTGNVAGLVLRQGGQDLQARKVR